MKKICNGKRYIFINMELNNVVLIGAGNVATHLGRALQKAGCRILQVYSRTKESAETLALMLDTTCTTVLDDVRTDADLYIVALKDCVLPKLVSGIVKGREGALFVHTAGSVSMDVWKECAVRYGVLYPMQTFSKQRNVDFADVPFFIEADREEDKKALKVLARRISPKVYEATSDQRKSLHIAAVFACNFTNHMYALCHHLLAQHGMPFEAMLPLIDETARKVHELSPIEAQTGPAVRYDVNVINRHLEMLAGEPEVKDIYEMISKSIHRYDKL